MSNQETEEEWRTEHHLLRTEQVVPILYQGSRSTTSATLSQFLPAAGRRPALWRSVVQQTAFDWTASDLSADMVDGHFAAGVNVAQDRYQQVLLDLIVQDIWPLLVGSCIAEEILVQTLRQQARTSVPFYYHSPTPVASTVKMTPQHILTRLKAACTLLYHLGESTSTNNTGRRSTRRQLNEEQQLPPTEFLDDLWKVTPGARAARRVARLLDHLDYSPSDASTDELAAGNPYLQVDQHALVEWLGKKTARFLSHGDFQDLWPNEIVMVPEDQQLCLTTETRVLGPTASDTNTFMRSPFVLGETPPVPTVSEWENARYAFLQKGACTTWPAWDTRVRAHRAPASDEQLAQMLQAQEEEPIAATRTGRRKATQVFYGTQSGMTQKQLMDTILRHLSIGPKTCADLLHLAPSESADPLKRIQGALGKLYYKRRQCSRVECTGDNVEAGAIDQVSLESLEQYETFLRQTESQLRKMLLEQWNDTPVVLVAMAADERENSMETLDDDADYSALEFTTNHPDVGKYICRPSHKYQVDESPSNIACQWYLIQDYCESTPATSEPEQSAAERGNIGNAKEPALVDRRQRFRVVPEEGPMLLLTEAQIQAGLLAAKMQTQATEGSKEVHPFSNHIGSRVCMMGRREIINGIIAGTNAARGHHQILVLPDSGESFWATEGDDHVAWKTESGEMYTMQQFDYDQSSEAYKQCLSVLHYLQRTPKAAPFAVPVDPIALGIPTYFDVIKQPMDLSTIESKLADGKYSVIPSSPYRSPVARMINGAFKTDICIMFDNAMTFNPPHDWIHQAAQSLKRTALKKIENATRVAEDTTIVKPKVSIYVDDDSDVDAYVYESDADDEYVGGGRRGGRKRHRPKSKEDSSVRAIEKVIRDKGIHSYVGNMDIQSNLGLFSLPSDKWRCRLSVDQASKHETASSAEDQREYAELQDLLTYLEESEEQSSRRSLRVTHDKPQTTVSLPSNLEYYSTDDVTTTFVDRAALEKYLQEMHESFAREKFVETGVANFPPYLGRVVNGIWEIPSDYLPTAIKYVVRGLMESKFVSQLGDDTYIVNNYYYLDPDVEPFEQVYRRQNTIKKEDEAEPEEDVEMSEYERLRAERVARNAERLKALGLA